MDLFTYMDRHPAMAVFVLLLCWCSIHLAFRAWNRFLLSRNIKNRGWPPEHRDADGDFKPTNEKDG